VIAVVVTGGESPDYRHVSSWFEKSEFVVGADSGLDTLGVYGVQPDIAVGDFDSVDDEGILATLSPESVFRFPADKNETDTEIGVRFAFERGADEVVLIGGGGGRMDHLFGIYEMFQRERCPKWWFTRSERACVVADEVVVRGAPGETLSFLPVGAVECRMRSYGLRWPLDELRWVRGDIGICNEFIDTEAGVTMISGRLLLIRSIEVAV
jgi:thiamine pyrophosphokinase